MLYKELKSKIIEGLDSFPESLRSKPHIYYSDVRKEIEISITLIDSKIESIGSKRATKLIQVKAAKANLLELYEALQVRDNWNQDKEPRSRFNNRMDFEVEIKPKK